MAEKKIWKICWLVRGESVPIAARHETLIDGEDSLEAFGRFFDFLKQHPDGAKVSDVKRIEYVGELWSKEPVVSGHPEESRIEDG